MKILNFTLFLILSSLSTGCGQKPTGRLLVFGDSISFGAYADESYPKLLAEKFNLELDNHSLTSTTLADDAQIGAIRSMNFKAGDRILFSPGINDAGIHKSDPAYLSTYEELLIESLDRFESSGGIAFVGEPLHVMEQEVSPENTAQLAKLNQGGEVYANILRRVTAKKGYRHVHLVESREQFHPLPELMHDGVHPNDSGHRELFGIFQKAMERILK